MTSAQQVRDAADNLEAGDMGHPPADLACRLLREYAALLAAVERPPVPGPAHLATWTADAITCPCGWSTPIDGREPAELALAWIEHSPTRTLAGVDLAPNDVVREALGMPPLVVPPQGGFIGSTFPPRFHLGSTPPPG